NASLESATATQLVAVVPNGDVDGKIKVTVGTETATSIKDFTLKEPEEQLADVYAAGYYYNGSFSAMYWKNDEEIVLEDGESSAESIYVSNEDDVYVGGHRYLNGVKTGTVWKNNEIYLSLSNEQNETNITSIYVKSDGTLYSAGSIRIDGIRTATVWEDGEVLYSMNEFGDNSQAESIVVDGTDVLVGGREFDPNWGVYLARIWKNGQVIHELGDFSESRVWDLCLHNDEILASGEETIDDEDDYKGAMVWKNSGTLYTLNKAKENAVGFAIGVTLDGAIITAGYEKENNSRFARYWNNSNAITIGSEGSQIMDLFIKNNDKYFGGVQGNAAIVWKNEEVLFSFAAENGEKRVNSIFVK
ncbi:MAG: hypothetical protein AB3N10_06455, partial [Allomuricauda sp.]